MRISQTVRIAARPEDVFCFYTNADTWPKWDPEVVEVALPHGLRIGATGWLKPRKGPRASIRITDVQPARSFTVESKLPLCRMVVGHELTAERDVTVVTHWVAFTGPLGFLFRRLIGSQIRATLPGTMEGLKHACEQAQVP